MLDPQWLELVVCPVTRSRLRLEGDHLVSETAGLKYPIRDGIPILLAEEAILPEGVKSIDELLASRGK